MTGAVLRTARKAACLSQIALAKRAGISRHAVSYWECKSIIRQRWSWREGWPWAVARIAEILPLPGYVAQYAPARGKGVIADHKLPAWVEAEIANKMAAQRERDAQRASCRRVICGAKTRKGTTCKNKSEAGRARCKFHGGNSTGARTPEGIARIAEAQHRRWAQWHEAKAANPAAAGYNNGGKRDGLWKLSVMIGV